MNQLKILAVVLAAAAALASCYWAGNWGQGGLTIDISQIKPKQDGDVVRVYLLADGKLFSTCGGVPFAAEVPYTPLMDTRVSIQGLPVGPQYQALVGIGPVSGGIFTPSAYCKSGLFQVSPGTDTMVAVSYPAAVNPFRDGMNPTSDISFSADLMGKNLKGVVETGSYAYTADDSNLYLMYCDTSALPNVLFKADYYDLIADIDLQGVSSFRVSGLSDDGAGLAYEAFISAPSGILPFFGGDGVWYFKPEFSSALTGNKDILESASFLDGADYAFFFRRAGGLGGTRVGQMETSNYSTWTWVNVDVPGVLDLAVSNNFAYFATTGGAFALPPAFLTDLTPTVAEHRMAFSALAPIVSLDFSTGDNTLYMGTKNGAYMANVTEIVSPPTASVGSSMVISGTEGQEIKQVAVSRYAPTSHQAFLSDYWLYIRKNGYLYEIPFFAVLPGKPTGMSWDSNYVLYISGTEGLSAVNVGFC